MKFKVEKKQIIRERIWKLLEQKGASRFPGARGRIPNFVGSERCARWLSELTEWQKAKVIKANPDSPQRQIRYSALKEGKILYMAVPRLASQHPFIELNPQKLKDRFYEASSIKGAFRLGRPVNIEEMQPIGLVVCGSVAVNKKGERIGKGEGYSELEFALAIEFGKLRRDVPVITSVHPLQLIAEQLDRKRHDFRVDIILTPEKILRCPKDLHRPAGIYWNDLSQQKIQEISVLKRLYEAAHKKKSRVKRKT